MKAVTGLLLAFCLGVSTVVAQNQPSMQEMMQKLTSAYSQGQNGAQTADTSGLMQTYAKMLSGAGGGAGGEGGAGAGAGPAGEEMQKMMAQMMGGTKPNDPSSPGKPMKPDSASMMMPLLMMPLVMGMGGGQGAERRAWAQPPRWWFQPPWWWNQPPWWFNQEPAWAANDESDMGAL